MTHTDMQTGPLAALRRLSSRLAMARPPSSQANARRPPRPPTTTTAASASTCTGTSDLKKHGDAVHPRNLRTVQKAISDDGVAVDDEDGSTITPVACDYYPLTGLHELDAGALPYFTQALLALAQRQRRLEMHEEAVLAFEMKNAAEEEKVLDDEEAEDGGNGMRPRAHTMPTKKTAVVDSNMDGMHDDNGDDDMHMDRGGNADRSDYMGEEEDVEKIRRRRQPVEYPSRSLRRLSEQTRNAGAHRTMRRRTGWPQLPLPHLRIRKPGRKNGQTDTTPGMTMASVGGNADDNNDHREKEELYEVHAAKRESAALRQQVADLEWALDAVREDADRVREDAFAILEGFGHRVPSSRHAAVVVPGYEPYDFVRGFDDEVVGL